MMLLMMMTTVLLQINFPALLHFFSAVYRLYIVETSIIGGQVKKSRV
jgi:hypothetical protein